MSSATAKRSAERASRPGAGAEGAGAGRADEFRHGQKGAPMSSATAPRTLHPSSHGAEGHVDEARHITQRLRHITQPLRNMTQPFWRMVVTLLFETLSAERAGSNPGGRKIGPEKRTAP